MRRWADRRERSSITISTGDAEPVGYSTGILHELRQTAYEVNSHPCLNYPAHQPLFTSCFQGQSRFDLLELAVPLFEPPPAELLRL
jgi:hypothetical protein